METSKGEYEAMMSEARPSVLATAQHLTFESIEAATVADVSLLSSSPIRLMIRNYCQVHTVGK